ncbi:MAG TPA: peptide ABC transporter substrate-binding protein [Verrucomicrobiae bacterium]|jgi:peptide/nickel transport system substrate-binding protein|nr:peptide ABC transporter substrate-binding protein [Verrucomicrobiae bacterium]
MQFRLIRLRFRRRLHKGQRQVEDLGTQAEQQIEQHLFRRFNRLNSVRRFMTGWALLLVLLITGLVVQNISLSNYFQTVQPVPGGIYNEGVLGTFTNASPLYATSDADATVSKLLFAGLFTYNDQNQLVGDLASGYSVDARGTTYTVHLKPHLTWQDGQSLTSADVLFTYQAIQNPDAQSPLQSSWQGITVSAPDPLMVVFKLPDPLADFPYNMTNGIVPQHILANVPAVDLRSADFNTIHPVGAGPFAWRAVQVNGNDPTTAEEQIALVPFAGYQGGKPKLQEFIVHEYASQNQLVQAFQAGQLTAVEGLTNVPASLQHMNSIQVHSPLLTAATMVFFKTSSGVLADTQVRQALVEGANVPHIITNLAYPTRPVREPLLMGQLGYDPTLTQASFNPSAAQQLLNADGWVPGKDGIRSKAGQPLTFTLSAANTPEYQMVTHQLQQQWRTLGVNLQLQLQDSTDFQTTLSYHSYDAVLYGISIGVDPDVFVYWDSSQADIRSANRLNLSEWKNPTADDALEAGRTRLNPELRVIKYKPFLQAWQQDAPALGLYQPRLLYLTNGTVAGLSDNALNTSTDRFNNVQNWEIRQAKVTD